MYSLILHGRKLVELQKLRHLSVSVKLLQNVSAFSNSFSSASVVDASPRDGRNRQKFTVSYLVGSLGLTTKLAQSISRKVSFEEKGNPDSVLSLLRSHGFTDSQISSIITNYPGLLIANVEKSLGHKLKFLQSRGASTSELTDTLSEVPKILGVRGDKTISIYYDFVRDIIEADKSSKFERLCHSLPQGSNLENKIRNISVLREMGVPRRLLFPLLICGSYAYGKERFEESLKKVVEMDFDPTTFKFVEALRVVQRLSDKTLDEKVNTYERLGFTVDEIWEMFKKWPAFLTYSEKKILKFVETFIGLGFSRDEFTMIVKRYPSCIGYTTETVEKKTEFLVKKMNWPLKAVVLFPQLFGLSMEKRIVPRCNVIKALLSKGLLGDRESELPPISSVLAITNQAFLNKYVMKHNDKKLMAELMAIFTRDQKASALNKEQC